jgi:predicted lipid carrier protein YhbT
MIAPRLCNLLTQPLRWLPQGVHAGGLSLMLNHLLAHALTQGDLDFVRGKVICIEATDLGIRYRLLLDAGGFRAAPGWRVADVRFSGDAHTFLLLASQREDADSLFFQRLLLIEGDTATGLHLKNFLDALGDLSVPRPAREALARFTERYGRHCVAVGRTRESS